MRAWAVKGGRRKVKADNVFKTKMEAVSYAHALNCLIERRFYKAVPVEITEIQEEGK